MKGLNLTLVIAVVSLLVWAGLLFGLHVQSGAINAFYALGAVAVARRIMVGAPKFLS